MRTNIFLGERDITIPVGFWGCFFSILCFWLLHMNVLVNSRSTAVCTFTYTRGAALHLQSFSRLESRHHLIHLFPGTTLAANYSLSSSFFCKINTKCFDNSKFYPFVTILTACTLLHKSLIFFSGLSHIKYVEQQNRIPDL